MNTTMHGYGSGRSSLMDVCVGGSWRMVHHYILKRRIAVWLEYVNLKFYKPLDVNFCCFTCFWHISGILSIMFSFFNTCRHMENFVMKTCTFCKYLISYYLFICSHFSVFHTCVEYLYFSLVAYDSVSNANTYYCIGGKCNEENSENVSY